MPGLEDLYREIILDHYRSPRNRGELPTPPARVAQGHNPLCGDEITVYLQLDGDVVDDVKVGGQGCSISQSSASMMSQAIKGHSIDEVRALVRRFKGMMSITDESDGGPDGPDGDAGVPLGELEALQGVVKFPVRIKCATLGVEHPARGARPPNRRIERGRGAGRRGPRSRRGRRARHRPRPGRPGGVRGAAERGRHDAPTARRPSRRQRAAPAPRPATPRLALAGAEGRRRAAQHVRRPAVLRTVEPVGPRPRSPSPR